MKPFDATTRELIELGPAAWLEFLGIPVPDPTRVRVIDSNLSTISAEADKVMWVDDPEPWIQHVELQAGRDTRLDERLQLYNSLLSYRFRVPVRSTLVLLRPKADGPELTGTLEKRLPWGEMNGWFKYNVVKVWEQPVEILLAAGLPILPLAPVAKVELEQLPDVLLSISKRLASETTREAAVLLWAATKVLLGLRYPQERIDQIIEGAASMILGIRGIEESSVYQSIFAEGEAKGKSEGKAEGIAEGAIDEARKTLVRLGRRRFGSPDENLLALIAALGDLHLIEGLTDRILDSSSWDELLAGPR